MNDWMGEKCEDEEEIEKSKGKIMKIYERIGEMIKLCGIMNE